MYESPILITSICDQIASEVMKKEEEYVVQNVQQMGIDVNKEELLKALYYDRCQYDKGYIDGHAARDAEIVRCKDCKHRILEYGIYICDLDSWDKHERSRNADNENWFCADGEMK